MRHLYQQNNMLKKLIYHIKLLKIFVMGFIAPLVLQEKCLICANQDLALFIIQCYLKTFAFLSLTMFVIFGRGLLHWQKIFVFSI